MVTIPLDEETEQNQVWDLFPCGKCRLAVALACPLSSLQSWFCCSLALATVLTPGSLQCEQAGYGQLGSARWIRKLKEALMHHPSTPSNCARGFKTHTVRLALLVLSALKYRWFPCGYSGPLCFLGLFPSPGPSCQIPFLHPKCTQRLDFLLGPDPCDAVRLFSNRRTLFPFAGL